MKIILKSKLLAWFLSISIFSFTQEPIIPSSPYGTKEEYVNKVLENGDVGAYQDLFFILQKSGHENEYLIYSLFMANKYNYPDAFFWVYYHIIKLFDNNNIEIDEISLKTALEYLNKGVKLGSKNAEIRMSELLLEGRFLPQDTIRGIQLHMRGWNVTDSVAKERNLKYIRKKYLNKI